MQHHAHAFAQFFNRIIFHVVSRNEHLAACNIVKAGNQAYKRGFCAARAADDAHGFAGMNHKTCVVDHVAFAVFIIFKADITEFNFAVRHFKRTVGVVIVDVRHFVEHFFNTRNRRARHDVADENHRNHNDREQNLHNVSENCREVADFHLTRDNEFGAQKRNGQNRAEQHQHHHRLGEHHQLFGGNGGGH